jgi:DNA-binding MarR family transcriptional regulator
MANSSTSRFQSRSAGYIANHMARLFGAALAEALQPLQLAPAQFMTLLELWREEGLTQKELVQRLDVEQATMASTLNRMERDRLIERWVDPQDSRAQRIYLTARAWTLEAPAIETARSINKAALGDLTKVEQDSLLALMPRVIAALREHRRKAGIPNA